MRGVRGVGGERSGAGGGSSCCPSPSSIAAAEGHHFTPFHVVAPSFLVAMIPTESLTCVGRGRTALVRVGLTGHGNAKRERERGAFFE